MKYFCITILLLASHWVHADTGSSFIGTWNFDRCQGDITHYKDQLIVSKSTNYLSIINIPLEGPRKKKTELRFFTDRFWKQTFNRKKPSTLQRDVITKVMGKNLHIATIWSPIHKEIDREFLSSNNSLFSIVNNGNTLKVDHLGTSATSEGGLKSSKASCWYKRK